MHYIIYGKGGDMHGISKEERHLYDNVGACARHVFSGRKRIGRLRESSGFG